MTDPLLLAFPADDRLVREFPRGVPVPLTRLATRTWVTSREGTWCYQMTQRACGNAGFVPNVVAYGTDFEST